MESTHPGQFIDPSPQSIGSIDGSRRGTPLREEHRCLDACSRWHPMDPCSSSFLPHSQPVAQTDRQVDIPPHMEHRCPPFRSPSHLPIQGSSSFLAHSPLEGHKDSSEDTYLH